MNKLTFCGSMTLALLIAASAEANEKRNKTIATQCKDRIAEYVSGRLGDKGVPDNSALYLYVQPNGRCGYGFATGRSSVAKAKSAALDYCKPHAKDNNAAIKCTFVGQNRGIVSGVAKFYNK